MCPHLRRTYEWKPTSINPTKPTRLQLTSFATASWESCLDHCRKPTLFLSDHFPLSPSHLSTFHLHASLRAGAGADRLSIIGAYPELQPRDRRAWMEGEGCWKGKLPLGFRDKSCISQQREEDADFPICLPFSSSPQP